MIDDDYINQIIEHAQKRVKNRLSIDLALQDVAIAKCVIIHVGFHTSTQPTKFINN